VQFTSRQFTSPIYFQITTTIAFLFSEFLHATDSPASSPKTPVRGPLTPSPPLPRADSGDVRDILTLIIAPSSQINEPFAPIVVTMNDGYVHTGIVADLSGDNVTLNTDLTDPNQRVNVDRREVAGIETSPVSPMPPGLLNMLTEEEVQTLKACRRYE